MKQLILTGAVAGSLWGCNGDKGDTAVVATPVGPELSHTPPEGTFAAGDAVQLDVDATDPDGVAAVVVYFRTEGSDYWDVADLSADGSTWTAEVGPLHDPGLEYYFKASDDGDPIGVSYLPADGAKVPFQLDVRPDTLSLPFEESFEVDEEAGLDTLLDLDWWSPSLGFDGYNWDISLLYASEGLSSAYHTRGNDGADGIDNWLVSPALDFSTVSDVMASWQEQGRSNSNYLNHSLWISTGSRDPEDNEYIAVVEDLGAATEKEWGPSQVVDLSEWAGEPAVYLAWRYEGAYSDDWYLDEIRVEAFGPVLDLGSFSWDPDPVHPGESTTVSIDLDNFGLGAASGVEVHLNLPEGGGVVTAGDGDSVDIPAEGTASVDFTLAVDESLEDNRYLPLELALDLGDRSWTFELEMVVGLPSSADLSLTLSEAGVVRVVVGVGDPEDPDAEYLVYSGSLEAGANELQGDITDAFAMLPPGPGPDRWFAEVTTSAEGQVDAFSITYDGESSAATAVPATLDSSTGRTIVYLPEPPDPVLLSSSPSSAAPGDLISLSVNLRNDGEDTSGPVSATLSSLDSDVTVLDDTAIALTGDVWSSGETAALSGLQVQIGTDHVDSTPASLRLTLDDGIESWTVDLSVKIPWPVLRVYGVEIDDGVDNKTLDAGDTATLNITLANTGGLNTFGTVTGTLAIGSESTASASVVADSGYFGSINQGKTRDSDDFIVNVASGATGDTVVLELSLTDGTATYQATTTLILGEAPWTLLSAGDDPVGDNLDDYPFDYVNAWYRVPDGTQVELLLSSDVAYDADTLFVEAWAMSTGADYMYYRWVLQSGVGTMQGYTSSDGFQTIGTIDFEYPSETEVLLRWNIAEMGLAYDAFTLGLASGWCGPPEYYCDSFPDGWGYPYDTSFNPSGWYPLSW